MNNREGIKLLIRETVGVERVSEPVTIGIPFPIGYLLDKDCLSLKNSVGNLIHIQTEVLAKWPDNSIKWLLLDFFADCPSKSAVNYFLNFKDIPHQQDQEHKITIVDKDSFLTINTGTTVFDLDKDVFVPFHSIKNSDVELIDFQNCSMELEDDAKTKYVPVINNINIETRGFLRCTVKIEGQFESKEGEVFSDFFARLSFFSGKSVVKIDFTIRNPKAANHEGGLWDLGDPGSVVFNDLSLSVAMNTHEETLIKWITHPTNPIKSFNSKRLIIYQDSSGGKNWESVNHVNRDGEVKNSFRGYSVYSNDDIKENGFRSNPILFINDNTKRISGAVCNFWQNFPKSIEAKGKTLIVRLFPKQYNDLFELQGGEQKTHTFFLNFELHDNCSSVLTGIFNPLVLQTTPEWCSNSLAMGYFAPIIEGKNKDFEELIGQVINADNNVFENREKVDEYGWRNFGDVYANHELVGYKGDKFPFISHYNNQYDIINGCILQYIRTGDGRWQQIMNDLAKHVIDIDIYHTKKDRPAFSGGSFWHTDHFMHAETSTHRGFSKKNVDAYGLKSYGGGPSSENCYTTGLSMYYYITGNVAAKEAVIELADWIINNDKMEKGLLGLARKVKASISSFRNKYAKSPSRGKANSINTLLDAFELTKNNKYLLKAECIIKMYISPTDDIDMLNQQKMELRWSYLIFLQSLGKYLDIKDCMKDQDKMFHYARESLMHHANWMLTNEKPYKQLFHRVEIPSTTWPAQDIRKSVVFDYACKYTSGAVKDAFRDKAEYFFNSSIADILSFEDESKTFIRPLAVLMHYGVKHTYFQGNEGK